MPDGGTCGLEWLGKRPDGSKPLDSPLLIMLPGLAGGSQNLYALSLLHKAREANFNVVTILFRGAEGIPITTPKLSYCGCWQDVQTCVEYVVKKYVCDPKTGKRNTRVYAYGVSLGANVLGLYLGKVGEKAKEYLDAALFYATPWSTKTGYRYFYENCWGLFNYFVGLNLNKKYRNEQLPKMKALMSDEEYKWLSNALETNKTGLDHIDEHVIVKMFGYKDVADYYNQVSLCRIIP